MIKITQFVEMQIVYTWPLDRKTPMLWYSATQTATVESSDVTDTAACAAHLDQQKAL